LGKEHLSRADAHGARRGLLRLHRQSFATAGRQRRFGWKNLIGNRFGKLGNTLGAQMHVMEERLITTSTSEFRRKGDCGGIMKSLDKGREAHGRGLAVLVAMLGLALLSGCGGHSTTTTNEPPPPVISVSVSPDTRLVDQGASMQFSAAVSGSSNQAVTWSVQEGSVGGAISQTGLYSAPSVAMNVHVVARSVADSSKSATVLVAVSDVSVTMPSSTGVPRGRQRQFNAMVAGTVVKNVTWTIQEGIAGGTITTNGVYTAPMSGGPFHVTARSVADSSKSATSNVILVDGGFRVLKSAPLQARWSGTATLLSNGKVLIAGGELCEYDGFWGDVCGGALLSSAELFDPATETFSKTGSMSTARRSHTATLLEDGTVLITGGVNSSDLSDATAEIYDPATGGFTRVGDMADTLGRFAHTASLLKDGRVLITGGVQGEQSGFNGSTQSAELYDPTNRTFSRAGDMPKEADLHTASVLLDGTVLIIGGEVNSCPVDQHVTTFDPTRNDFSAGATLPKARAGHTATTLNDGRVLITGGADPCVSGTFWNTAVVFDPSTSSFSQEIVMNERRHPGHSATLLANGKVLIVEETAELFDPATSTFTVTGDPMIVYPGRIATRLADGRVLFTGITSFTEIYE
jgi:hypothetical protein